VGVRAGPSGRQGGGAGAAARSRALRRPEWDGYGDAGVRSANGNLNSRLFMRASCSCSPNCSRCPLAGRRVAGARAVTAAAAAAAAAAVACGGVPVLAVVVPASATVVKVAAAVVVVVVESETLIQDNSRAGTAWVCSPRGATATRGT